MINLLKNISLFLLVFGVINDDFVVDRIAGENALKAIFAFFLLTHGNEILKAFMKPKPKNTAMKFFYLFFFTFVFIGFLGVGLGYVEMFKAIFVVLPVIVVFLYVSYVDDFDKLLYFLWISIVFSAILAVFSDPLTQWTFRKTGGTGDPNEFAVHVLAGMGITVYLYLKNRNIFFLLGSMALFFYTLLYAGSKSSFLTLAILLLVVLFTKFRDVVKQAISLKSLIVLLILGVAFSFSNLSQMSAIKGMKERAQSAGTAKTRFVSWNAGLRMAEENLLTGVGIEQYKLRSRAYATDFMAEGANAPHNFLIKVLGEVGFFPFITLLLFLIVLFYTDYLKIAQSDYFWIYITAASVVLMGLTLSMSYEKYFWLFLGLLSHVKLVLFVEEKEEEYLYEDNAYLT